MSAPIIFGLEAERPQAGVTVDGDPVVAFGVEPGGGGDTAALIARIQALEARVEALETPTPPTPVYVDITVTGGAFSPTIALAAGSTATASWHVDGAQVATGLTPTIGGDGPRTVRLQVLDDDGDALHQVETLNVGYNNAQDAGLYMVGAGYNKTPQAVTGITNLAAMTGLIRFLAATPSLAGALDFTGMSALQFIECFQAKVTAVTLAGCSSLVRLCLEENALTTLDLNPVQSTLRDLRAANQVGDALAFTALTGPLALLYHFCVRDQTVTGHPTLAQMPTLLQLWNWNTGQTGPLAVGGHAHIQELRSYGNDYTAVTGPSASLQWIELQGNDFDQADVDAILVALNALATGGARHVDLTNTAAPSATGTAARAAMVGRGWDVDVDAPAAWSFSDTFDTNTAANYSGGGGLTIAGGNAVRTDSGAYQRVNTTGGGGAPADIDVTAIVSHATLAGAFFGLNARWDGTDGVRMLIHAGGLSAATNVADVHFGDAAGFSNGDVATVADDGFPASAAVNQEHTVTLRVVGTTATLIFDGQTVCHATVNINTGASGGAFGFCGEGSNRTYRSLSATAP